MIHYKTTEEIEIMRHSCLLVGKAHAELAKVLKPGMTTMQVNDMIETFIRDNGAVPSFKNYGGTYPFATCISVNDVVVHGFPNNNTIKDGDIISQRMAILFRWILVFIKMVSMATVLIPTQ